MGRLLNFILICLLILEPPLLSQAQTVVIPPVLKGGLQNAPLPSDLQAMINSYLAKVIASHSDADVPPTLTEREANFQYLNTQRIRVITKDGPKTINPAKLQLEVAPPFIHNPFTELDFSLTEEGNIFVRHKATGLYHEVFDINARSVTVDNHFIYIVNKDGEVLGASMKYLKGLLLQSPVPIFKLGEMPEDQKLPKGDYTLRVVTERTVPKKMSPYLIEKLRPPPGQMTYVNKGDLIMYDSQGVAIERFRQSDLMDEALADSTATRLIGLITDPYFYNSENEIRRILNEYKGDFELLKNRLKDPMLQKALSKTETSATMGDLSTKATIEGHERVEMLFDFYRNGSQRKQLIVERYLKATEADYKEAEAADAEDEQEEAEGNTPEQVALSYKQKLEMRTRELARATQEKLDRAITPKNMIRVAGILAALGGGAALDHYTGNHGALWATDMIAKMWSVGPTVLRGSLRWPTIRAAFISTLALPLIRIAAGLASVHTGWDFKRTLLIVGIRAYAILVGIVYVTSQRLRQYNFFPAIRAGQNPFDYPEMFNSPFASDKTIIEKRSQLENKYRREHRLHAFWWLVAHSYVMKTEKIDPLTLLAYEIDLAQRKKDGSSPMVDESKELDNWAEIAQELHEFFRNKITFDVIGDLRNIPAEELMVYLAQAENTQRDINSRSENKKKLKEIESRMSNIWRNTVPEVVGGAGFESYQAMMSLKPTHTISEQDWRKVKWYTLIGDAIDAVYGDRANPLEVGNLIASKTGFLGINPSYWLQQADTMSENLIVMPAELALTLDEGQREKLYLPDLPKKYPMQEASIMETTKIFFKTFFNLKKMDLGNINKLRVSTTALTFPAVFIPGFIFRITAHAFLGAPQSYLDAIPAQIYTVFMSMVAYGWADLASDRALTLSQQEVTQHYLAFRDIQVRLEQALERNDIDEAKEAYNRLAAEYHKRDKSSDLPATADDFISQAQALLEKSYEKPAAPPLPNEKVMSMITAVTVIGVTIMSIPFEIKAYGADPHWWFSAIKGLVYTSAFIGGGVLVQSKVINPIWDAFDKFREKRNQEKIEEEKTPSIYRRKPSITDWCVSLLNVKKS